MKNPPSSDDYLNLLFAQDSLLGSKEFAEHRRVVIQRLGDAQARERRARKLTVLASVCCALLFFAVYAAALLMMRNGAKLPEWLVNLIALVVILTPVTALLLCSIYFFRYRF